MRVTKLHTPLFILTVAAVFFSAILSGCGPRRDIFDDWLGEWRGKDNSGFLDFGCRTFMEGGRRYLSLWEYAGGIEPEERTIELSYFKLYDQYSLNYSGESATWLYIYRPSADGYPAFIVEEYYSGVLRPALVRGGPILDEERATYGDHPRTALAEYHGIPAPEVFGPGLLTDKEKDREGNDLFGMWGGYYIVEGRVTATERRDTLPYFMASTAVETDITYLLEPFPWKEAMVEPRVTTRLSEGKAVDVKNGETVRMYARLKNHGERNGVTVVTFDLQYFL